MAHTQELPRYLLGNLIGSGGFGRVYLGTQTTTGRPVVIKVVPYIQENYNRIRREVEIPSLLKGNKNIAVILDAIVEGDNVYIISEYINNATSLDRWSLPNITTTVGIVTLLNVMYELAQAYIYIHDHHIAHRDVKQENILMKNNIPIIIDWDLACYHQKNSLFPCEGFVGTLEYIAPEIWRREVYYNPFRADIYSLGIVFYTLANNRLLPYQAETTSEMVYKISSQQPRPSDCGYPFLDDIIMEMIDPNPQERIPLEVVANALQSLIKAI